MASGCQRLTVIIYNLKVFTCRPRQCQQRCRWQRKCKCRGNHSTLYLDFILRHTGWANKGKERKEEYLNFCQFHSWFRCRWPGHWSCFPTICWSRYTSSVSTKKKYHKHIQYKTLGSYTGNVWIICCNQT